MSSILRITHLNAINLTRVSLKSPGIGNLFCQECFERRLTLPQERRYASMNESILRMLQASRMKLKKSKYTELLKVSKNKAINKKITFGKLNASHVEAFAEQPGLVLGSLRNSSNDNTSQKAKQEEINRNDNSVTNAQENDCDTFGTLSNFSKSHNNNFSQSNFSLEKNYNGENEADTFGTLSDRVNHSKHEKYSNFKPPRLDETENDPDSFGMLGNKNRSQFSSRQPNKFEGAKKNFYPRKDKYLPQNSEERQKFLAEAENRVKNYLNNKSSSENNSENFGHLSNQDRGQFSSRQPNKFVTKAEGAKKNFYHRKDRYLPQDPEERQKYLAEAENRVKNYLNNESSSKNNSGNFGHLSNRDRSQFSSRQHNKFVQRPDGPKQQFHRRMDRELPQNSEDALKFLAEAENLVKNYLNNKNRGSDFKSSPEKISDTEKNYFNEENKNERFEIKQKNNFEGKDFNENRTKAETFDYFKNSLNKTSAAQSDHFNSIMPTEEKSLNEEERRDFGVVKNAWKERLKGDFSERHRESLSKIRRKEGNRFNSIMPMEKQFLGEGEEVETNVLSSKRRGKSEEDSDEYHKSFERTSKKSATGGLEMQAFKQRNLNEILESFMDVCVYSNNIDAAYFKLMNERQMSLKFKYLKITNLQIYNSLLHGYSQKGNWDKVKEVFSWIKEDDLKPNSQSYAAVFDCLARMKTENNEEFVNNLAKEHIEDFEREGFSSSDLFHKTQLIRDQREKILSIVRIVYPGYVVPKLEYQKNSDCELLDQLNNVCEPYKTQRPEEITPELLKELIEEQLQNENGMIFKVKAIHKPAADYHEKVEKLFESWRSILHDSFIKSVKMLKYEKNRSSELIVYLNSLPVETFVDCMLYEIKRTVSEFLDPPTHVSTKLLGTKVCQRYTLKKKEATGELDKLVDLYKKYTEWYLNPHGPAVNGRQYWQMLLENHPEGPHIDVSQKKWPYKVLKEVGNFLYQIIMKEVTIDLNFMHQYQKESRLVPVFYTQLQEENLKLEEVIKIHPIMQKIFQACNADSIIFDNDQIPMVCPPKPWSHVNSGGYLLQKTMYIRPVVGVFSKPFDYTAIPQTQLYPTFDSLNQLQSIPWRINENVLDVALQVFKDGGSEELNVPSLPDLKPMKIDIDKEMSKQVVQNILKQRKKAALEKVNEYGLWCEALYKLSLADHFRKKMIWLPQNMDFRGRVYPVPPHITHLGADLYRSLFLFAKGKELGSNGLDWLKIHTINLTGTHKKKSIQERLEYANEILPEILDSAERPLDGSRWWVKSDEQWQTLAACMEIKKALDSPDPEKYVCRFPVHQDGSCNGLQHYAALGRDVIGAKSVNLTPSEVPQDVYSVVVGIVERKRKEDQEAGVKIAEILDGFVNRRVIKQTIMTTVYGVTSYGAKLQIIRQLEDVKEFPQEHKQWAAAYLTQKTFESLNEMFTSARDIQHWFVNCAGIITSVKKDYVKWISPVGLPVEQPYGKKITPKGKESVPSLLVPNTMKQKNAFPPNFVHSLDSSHMMLTSLHCEQAGITFASIHDCFWTHPCSVEIMNRICREQFISLHSQPILENLSQYFLDTYKGLPKDKEKVFLNIPPRGEFDLNSVKQSLYFFS